MGKLSVVIIAKNEAAKIAACVASALQVTNNVVVADSGSTDDTKAVAAAAGAVVIELPWTGYGPTRNAAALHAENEWILSLDADEQITPALAAAINALDLPDPKVVWGFKRANHLGRQRIRHGEWGRDKVYRIYNKTITGWNDAIVHEMIALDGLQKQLIAGDLLHFTMQDLAEFKAKSRLYARLSAEKYLAAGKKATIVKRFLSPAFNFVQHYIIGAGFLDGRAGLGIACASSHYVYLKYRLLHEMQAGKLGASR